MTTGAKWTIKKTDDVIGFAHIEWRDGPTCGGSFEEAEGYSEVRDVFEEYARATTALQPADGYYDRRDALGLVVVNPVGEVVEAVVHIIDLRRELPEELPAIEILLK